MKKDKDMNENKKMKKNKLIIFLTGIFLTIFLFVTLGSAKAEPIEKNETVYVILNHDGSVKMSAWSTGFTVQAAEKHGPIMAHIQKS